MPVLLPGCDVSRPDTVTAVVTLWEQCDRAGSAVASGAVAGCAFAMWVRSSFGPRIVEHGRWGAENGDAPSAVASRADRNGEHTVVDDR